VDQALSVTESSFLKVPFDLDQWRHFERPEHDQLHSEDPTQWLFSGDPVNAEQPLQVAVGRLVGYCWPRQTGSSIADCPELPEDALASLADQDGIVCISAIKGEEPAEERLRALLSVAYGSEWSGEKLQGLLAQVALAERQSKTGYDMLLRATLRALS
jgi:hypothetical protein